MANSLYSSVKKWENRKIYEISAVVFVLISPFILSYLISIQPERVLLLYSILLISLGLSKICPDIVLGIFLSGVLTFIFALSVPSLNDISGWSLLPLVTSGLYFMLWSKKRYIPFGPLVHLQIFYFMLLLLGVMYTSMYEDAVTKVWRFSYYNFMPFICPMLFLGNEKRLRNILLSFFVGILVWSTFGFIIENSASIDTNAGSRLGSGESSLSGPIGFGRTAGLTCTFIVAFFITSKGNARIKLLLVPIGLWALYNMLLTGTRGVLISFLITLLLVCVLHYKKYIISLKVILLGIMITLALVSVSYYVPQVLRERMLGVDSYQDELYGSRYSNKTHDRRFLYMEAWKMFKGSPLIGCGTSAFVEVSNYPHNIFLEIAVENGILGLIAFSLFIFLNLRYAWLLLSSSKYSNFHKKAGLFLIGGFVFVFIEAQFSLDITGNRHLWFFSGLIWTVYKDAITVQKKKIAA